jgi:hypothetical protein
MRNLVKIRHGNITSEFHDSDVPWISVVTYGFEILQLGLMLGVCLKFTDVSLSFP